MYEVKYFEFGNGVAIHTLFRSHYMIDCWDFVRNHLTCEVTRDRAKEYVVVDSIGQFCDPTIDVIHLKRYAA